MTHAYGSLIKDKIEERSIDTEWFKSMNFTNSTQRSNTDLFIGSSLSSLILACHHKSVNPDNDVVILDSLPKVGGGNGSYFAKNGELFDYGMRVYYDDIKQLDSIVAQSLPHEDLIFLEDNKKTQPLASFRARYSQTLA